MNLNRNKTIFKELYFQPYKKHSSKLIDYSKDNIDFVQRLGLIKTLPLHQGCVNTLCWNDSGSLLLSGSDDQHLVVTNGHTYKVCSDYRTSHRANIFSAKFMPVSGDHNIVSCSGDGIVLYTDLERPSETYYSQFNCHSGTSYEVITIPNDPNTFFSCGEDGTVRWFDLRIKSRCKKARCKEDILIAHHRAITALSINPIMPHELAIGSSDSTVRTFDRRMLGTVATGYMKNSVHEPIMSFTVPELQERTYRTTSLSYSQDGQEMLVSYSSDYLYLFRVRDHNDREVIVDKTSPKSNWAKLKTATKRARRSPPPVRRLRLRGDWSDTGPDARPERDATNTVSIGQARPQLQATLMERMTNVLFRMLNDPLTRAALSAGGEDSLETNSSSAQSHDGNQHHDDSGEPLETSTEEHNDINDESFDNEHDALENSAPGTATSTTTPTAAGSGVATTTTVASSGGSSSSSGSQHLQPSRVSFSLSIDEQDSTKDSSKPSSNSSSSSSTTSTSSNSSSGSNTDQMVDQLHDKLSTLRHGFIEKHGAEPAVSLHYSEQSSSSSTIQLGVANELNRANYNNYDIDDHQQPSTSRPTEKTPNNNRSSQNQNDSNNVHTTSSNSNSCDKSTLAAIAAAVAATSNSSQSQQQQQQQQQQQSLNTNDSSVDDLMDFSSNDELMPDAPSSRESRNSRAAEKSGSDVELDYSDSDDENDLKNNTLNEHAEQCSNTVFQPHVKQKYMGHRNARTMIKEATFWGNDYVMSGSDCGHVFIWNRSTAKLVMLLQADHHVVNCLQPHPTLPLLATSGIDHDVKLWSPILEEPNFDYKMAEDLMKRNEIMLEETRDTITVPAAFMIRMLACLNQIRRTGTLSRSRRRDEPEPDN